MNMDYTLTGIIVIIDVNFTIICIEIKTRYTKIITQYINNKLHIQSDLALRQWDNSRKDGCSIGTN